MFLALRIRDFRLLWTGRMVSLLGSWLLVIAIPAHVYELTGSLLATGLTLAAEFLPPLLLGPVAGVLTDRWDRRRLMIGTDVLRACAVALLLISPDLVYVALVLESVGTVLFRPAAQALTPAVVGTGPALSSASSLNAVTDGVVGLVGPPLGGALLATAGFTTLVWIDVLSYVVSALALLLMKAPAGRGARGPVDLVGGLRFVWGSPVARGLLVVTTWFLAANAALTALLVPFGVHRLGGTAQIGFVLSGLGVGFLLGAPLIKLLDRISARYLLALATAAVGLGFFALFNASSVPFAIGAAVWIGVSGAVIRSVPQLVLQRVVPDFVLGRVGAVFLTGEALATLLGAVAGPLLAEVASLALALNVGSLMTLLGAGLVLVLVPSARTGAPAARPRPALAADTLPR